MTSLTAYPDKVAEGNEITFGWSLTSIYNTPESLTFDAVNTDSGNTYTMGSVAGGDTTFKWDPYKHFTDGNDPPLVYSTYQVRVYDDNGPSAAAKPGGFMPNSNLRFALYKPEKYTPLDGKRNALFWFFFNLLLLQNGSVQIVHQRCVTSL